MNVQNQLLRSRSAQKYDQDEDEDFELFIPEVVMEERVQEQDIKINGKSKPKTILGQPTPAPPESELKIEEILGNYDQIESNGECIKDFKIPKIEISESGQLENNGFDVKLKKIVKNPCKFCGKLIISWHMKNHEKIHTGEKPFSCNVCQRGFIQKSGLMVHMEIHSANRVKPYSCEVCGASFTLNQSLIKHSRTHTGEKPYKCKVCDKYFRQTGALTTHMKLLHPDYLDIKKSHRQSQPPDQEQVQLQQPESEWRIKSTRKIKCRFCDKILLTTRIQNHERVHTGERPYECTVCNKTFKQKSGLNVHMQTHLDTSQRPALHSCDICKKSFTLKSNLMQHLNIHTNEKPYTCSFCQKSFNHLSSLNKHKNTHLGVVYPCRYCDKSFSYKQMLNQHLKQMHSNSEANQIEIVQKIEIEEI